MNELDQLRADLSVLERYDKRQGTIFIRSVREEIERKIARIEAEQADPWRDAKDAVEYFRGFAKHRSETDVVKLVDHLTAENERLAKEIVALGNHLDVLTENFRERDAELNEAIKRESARAAELEREQVWGIHSQIDGHLIEAFVTKEEADAKLAPRGSEPTFREVRVAKAEDIVRSLREAQNYESKYRVERDKALSRVAELEANLPRGFREHDDHGK